MDPMDPRKEHQAKYKYSWGFSSPPESHQKTYRALRQHVDFGSMSRQNLKDLLDLVDRLGLVVKFKKKPGKQRGKWIRTNTSERLYVIWS